MVEDNPLKIERGGGPADSKKHREPMMVILEGAELKEEGEPPVTTIQEIDNNIDINLLADGGASPTANTSGKPESRLRSVFSYKEVSLDQKPGNFDQTKLQARATYL